MNDSTRPDDDQRFSIELERELEALGKQRSQKESRHSEDSDSLDSSSKMDRRLDKARPVLDLLLEFQHRPELLSPETEPLSGDQANRTPDETDVIPDLKRLGRFEIEGEIGRGGNGIVLKAKDQHLARHVAIKIPRLSAALSGEMKVRFEREAKAAGSLNHPGIVAIHEVGHEQGVDFIVSQFVEGENLAEWARRNPMTTQQAAACVAFLADAIQHAHGRGVLHRDLKPSNVIVETSTNQESASPDDDISSRCRIVDFGLAVIKTDVAEDLTNTGVMIGTPAYMSPEQTESKSDAIGPATDVYGLGVVLYQLLAGKPPFAGNDLAAIVHQVRKTDPEPTSVANPAVERDLDAICLRCLEKNPDHRYLSAFALQQDLRRFLEGEPVDARPVSRLVRLTRWALRHPQTATMLTAIIGLMFVLTIGSTIAAISISRSRTKVVEHLNAETLAKQRATESEEAAQRTLFESSLSNAAALVLSGRQGQSRKSFEAVETAMRLKDRLDIRPEQYARMRSLIAGSASLCDISLQREYRIDDPLTSIVHNDQLEIYAIANRAKGEIEIRDVENNSVQKKLLAQEHFYSEPVIVFSRDSRFLGASYKFREEKWYLLIWDLDRPSESPMMKLEVPSSRQCRFDFSADNRYLACFLTDGKLSLIDLETGKRIASTETTSYIAIKFQNCGNLLAAADAKQLNLLAFDGSKLQVAKSKSISTRLIDLSWSADDAMLAGGGNNKVAYVWNMPNLSLVHRFLGHGWQVIRVDFHPENQILGTYSRDRTTRIWDLDSGQQLLQSEEIQLDRFGRSGDILATKNGSGKLWRNNFHHVIETVADATEQLSIHSNGRVLAICKDDRLQFIDLISRQTLFQENVAGSTACFSPDGNSLVIASQFGIYASEISIESSGKHDRMTIGRPVKLNDLDVGGMLNIDSAARLLAVTVRYPQHRGAKTAGFLNLQNGDWHALDPLPVNARWNDLTSDGKQIAVGKWHGGGTVTVWDTATGQTVQTLDHKNAQVKFSNDGRLLAVDDGSSLTVYRTSDWKRLFQRGPKTNLFAPMPIAFSNKNNLIANLANRRRIEVIDLDNFQTIFTLNIGEDEFIETLQFTRDDRRLVAGSGRKVHVWDLPLYEAHLEEARLSLGLKFGAASSSSETTIEFQLDPLKAFTSSFAVSKVVRMVEAHQQILSQNENSQSQSEAFEQFVATMQGIDLVLVPAAFQKVFSDLLEIWQQQASYLKKSIHLGADSRDDPDEISIDFSVRSKRMSEFKSRAEELWSKCLEIHSELERAVESKNAEAE